MVNVCHLFDDSVGWEQRIGASQLLEHLPPQRYSVSLAAFDAAAAAELRGLNRQIRHLVCPGGLTLIAAPSLARLTTRHGIHILHAWGAKAALAAGAVPHAAVVCELYDPRSARRHVKLLRSIARPKGFALVCGSRTILSRLVAGGVPPDLCTVIRPGVDFAAVNRHRRTGLRDELGITPGEFVAVVPESAQCDDDLVDAFLAVKLTDEISRERLRIIVPGARRGSRRLAAFAAALPGDDVLVTTGSCYPFEKVLSNADALIVAVRGDTPTTAIAWAMGANVGIIASAVYAVAELVADKLNGLLFKQVHGERMISSIARLLRNRTALARAREAARGQAYEVFGLRRCIEQHMRVYDNVLAGVAPGEGIVDSAVAG
ncbi:MAG: glycosyltransferase [Phycisphaerae bacterium]